MRPIAFLELLIACTHAPPADPLRVDAVLEQTGATTFKVVLRPSRPVTRLLFARPGDGDRLRTWRIVEPAAARFESSGDREEVVARSPIERLVLEVPIHRYLPENDYAPFLLLSGGGVLVYTGQLDVEGATEQTFELRPQPGELVVVAGLSARGPLRWTSVNDGTYAAFGPLEPVEEARFVALIDAGFPRWLREEARALLPRLFDHYAAVLGRELPFRPAVLLSYSEEAEHPGSISLKGGTLTGLLQQDVRLGSNFRAAGQPMVLEAFRASLAHEAAHLWNTRVIRPRGPTGFTKAVQTCSPGMRCARLESSLQSSTRLVFRRPGRSVDRGAAAARYPTLR